MELDGAGTEPPPDSLSFPSSSSVTASDPGVLLTFLNRSQITELSLGDYKTIKQKNRQDLLM
jgi:hypothetical protein